MHHEACADKNVPTSIGRGLNLGRFKHVKRKGFLAHLGNIQEPLTHPTNIGLQCCVLGHTNRCHSRIRHLAFLLFPSLTFG